MDEVIAGVIEDRGNIQQRVFETVPLHPAAIPIFGLYEHLPFDRRSIQNAVAALVKRGFLEPIRGSRLSYRRVTGVSTPEDGRGWPKGKPRP